MADINEMYEKAVAGDTEAQFSLAVALENGEGVARDINQAIAWYLRVAEKGFASAQYNLGNCYQDDSLQAKDYAASAYWYGKAAEQGHLNATYMLAMCYKNGEGVAEDHKKMKELLQFAAGKGHEPSIRMLDKIKQIEKESYSEARRINSANTGAGKKGCLGSVLLLLLFTTGLITILSFIS